MIRRLRLLQLHRAVLLLVIGALLVASCDAIGTEESEPTTTTAPPVTIVADPVAGAVDVAPDHVITITASQGTIGALTVTSPAGAVAGVLSDDNTTWQSTATLIPLTTYQVVGTTVDLAGNLADIGWQFTTGKPANVFRAVLSPGDDKVVGVGMPAIVKLTSAVPPARHAGFVSRLKVTTVPAVVGAWHWFSDTELHWRPKDYWPAGTKVEVDAEIAGYTPGDGSFGVKDVNIKYVIGESHISTVDVNAHSMSVMSNGVVVKTIPVSTGRDQYPTHGGVHVASEKANPKIMDSSTVGIPRDGPGGYYESVPFSVRISNSGEFVHAASWSTGAHGNSNVSHGCVNVSPTDGQWFYDFTQIGDVVQVVGSPVQLEPTNGWGDWQIPWAQWAN
ncbi:MAG: Ig-like domain-containing protein [Acidimicrobiales bacterium]